MHINHHNYEEYFILYMDNELGAVERRQVEEFVKLHPDLKDELDSLLHYKLTPDHSITYPAKADLLKGKNGLAINLANYEEWLVLFIDNELNEDDRLMVESFITDNPQVQPELELLQKIKLQPENIIMADKSSLYRREERKVPVLWWRMAAAAILLAIFITTGLLLNKRNSTSKTEVVDNNPVIVPEKKNVTPVIADRIKPELPLKKEIGTAVIKKNNVSADPEKIVKNIPEIKKKEEAVVVNNDNKPSNNLPQPVINNIPANNIPKDALAKENIPIPADVTSPIANPSDIKAAVYPSSTDEGFAKEGKDGKKNKLRGLFRKITRTFEKRTNIDPASDDNKLLVGGFSINLK